MLFSKTYFKMFQKSLKTDLINSAQNHGNCLKVSYKINRLHIMTM